MKILILIIGLFFALLVLFSCERVITWDTDKTEIRLVVEGDISTDSIQHSIKLSQISPYSSNELPPAVEGAHIELIHNNSIIEYIESDEQPGTYILEKAFAGQVLENYQLSIVLAESIGETRNYTASITIPQTPTLDSIDYKLDTIRGFNEVGVYYDFYTYFQDNPSKGDHYQFKVYRNGDLETNYVNDYLLTSDEGWNNTYFDSYVYSIEYEFIEYEDKFSIELIAISEDYYNFILALQEEAAGKDPIGFSGPSSNVYGNISGGALGYFNGINIKRDTLVID